MLEYLIVLAVLWIVWLLAPKRWRRWLITPLAIALVAYGVLTAPFTLNLATNFLLSFLPTEVTPEPADAIVVLGRGPNLEPPRVDVARQLWQAKSAPQIFASGMSDSRPIVQELEAAGVLPAVLRGENCSQTTRQNGLFTAAILYPEGVRRIDLVTDPPHLFRSYLVFNAFGFQVIPYAAPLPPDLPRFMRVIIVWREYPALLDYALRGFFKSVPVSRLEPPPNWVSKRIQDWNCKVSGVR